MVWLGRAVNHAGSGQAAGAGVGQMMVGLPGGNGGHGGHGLGGGGYGYSRYGPVSLGPIGLILVVLLLLYFTGNLPVR